MRQSRNNQGGFTLVSVLVAITLLTIGLMALARTQSVMVKAQSTMATRSTALVIAQTYTEIIRSRDPATLASEAPVQVDATGQPNAAGQYRRSTVVTNDATNLLRVTISVDFPQSVSPIQIITLIYKKTP